MEETKENSIPVKETKKSIRVQSIGNRDKPRFFGEEEQLYCCLDNHKCDGPCRKVNTEAHGTLICSEVISSKFLPRKRRKKKFFRGRRDREDRDENSFV